MRLRPRADGAGLGRVPRWQDDRGQAGGIETLPFAVLIFVVGTMMIANLWGVIDARLAMDAATRDAARTLAEAPSGTAGEPDARTAAADALRIYGKDPAQLAPGGAGQFTVSYANPTTGAPATWQRCAAATVTATYRLSLINLPLIGSYLDVVPVSSSHSELIDPYRSSADPTAGALC